MNTYNIRRRGVLGLVLAAPALAARANDRPIRLVSPFPPGATNDNVARTLARALTPRLGSLVMVENRAGAGGAVGARFVAESRPDGLTLLNASAGNLTIAPHLSRVGYDPLRDLAPVAMAGEAWSLLAVNPALPVRDLAGFIAHARANPGKLNYASAGIGSAGHLRGALLAEEIGAELVHVPYPGSAPAATATMAGDTHLFIDPVVAPHVAGGRLRGLASIGRGRWPEFAELPNLAEAGVGQDWPNAGWFGVFAPAGVPEGILAGINAAVNEALADAEVAATLRRFGLQPEPLTRAQVGARVAADHARVGGAVQRLSLV